MKIIKLEAGNEGYRPPIQSWNNTTPPIGYIEVPPDVDTSDMQNYCGFVDLTIESGILTKITGNEALYNHYLETLPEPEPEPEPTLDDRVTTLEDTKADKTDVENIWDELAAAYTEGVNSI